MLRLVYYKTKNALPYGEPQFYETDSLQEWKEFIETAPMQGRQIVGAYRVPQVEWREDSSRNESCNKEARKV